MTRPPTIMQIASSTIDHANDGRNEEHAWTSKRRPEIQVVKLHCLRSNPVTESSCFHVALEEAQGPHYSYCANLSTSEQAVFVCCRSAGIPS